MYNRARILTLPPRLTTCRARSRTASCRSDITALGELSGIRIQYRTIASMKEDQPHSQSGGSTRQGSGIQKRAVAGSFLFKIPNGDSTQAKVALCRRSDKVRTYQHKLAPVSGSVEESDRDPMSTALREINEETTLSPSSLELLRVGKPYSFVDESIGREWTVNPFAFRLKDVSEGGKGEAGIRLDWEHEGLEWFDPLDVKDTDDFGGVPNLVKSLRRVWPEYDLGHEVGEVLTRGLRKLHEDHESGARQLAASSIRVLRDMLAKMDRTKELDDQWWANVRLAAWHICKCRESMGAAITTAVVKALSGLFTIYQGNAQEDRLPLMIDSLNDQLDMYKSSADSIRDNFIEFLRDRICSGDTSNKTVSMLTLSSSSTIADILLEAARALALKVDLRILESRPLCEGVSLASKLLKADEETKVFTISLFSDASAALAATSVDLVIIGCDRLSSDGDVSNKMGSLPAVLSARHASPRAKVMVVTETSKIAAPGSMAEHESEENDPAELVRGWKGVVNGAEIVESMLERDQSSVDGHQRVSVKNAYFEWVPAPFIDAYVTDEGLWSGKEIASRSTWIQSETKRWFDDL